MPDVDVGNTVEVPVKELMECYNMAGILFARLRRVCRCEAEPRSGVFNTSSLPGMLKTRMRRMAQMAQSLPAHEAVEIGRDIRDGEQRQAFWQKRDAAAITGDTHA